MRELSGRSGGGGGGGTVVAAAVAVLEKQALSSSPTSTPSVKTQTPQDNTDNCRSNVEKNERRKSSPDDDRSRKSASPLSRSESFKKLNLNGEKSEDNVCKTSANKVTVIGAKLKQSSSPIREITFATSSSDVDALCSDLMSNLEQALAEKKKSETNGSSYHTYQFSSNQRHPQFYPTQSSVSKDTPPTNYASSQYERFSTASLPKGRSSTSPESNSLPANFHHPSPERFSSLPRNRVNSSPNSDTNRRDDPSIERSISRQTNLHPSPDRFSPSFQTNNSSNSVSTESDPNRKSAGFIHKDKPVPPNLSNQRSFPSSQNQQIVPPPKQNFTSDKDITKSSRSGFAYVDLRNQDQETSLTDGVVLRHHGEERNGVECRNSSSTNDSVVTSEDFESNSSDESSTETSSDTESSSDEGRVHIVNEGLETITEEERPVTASSVRTQEGIVLVF